MTGGRKRRFCKEGSLFVAGRENAQSQYCVHLAPSSYWVLELPQEAKPKFMMFYVHHTHSPRAEFFIVKHIYYIIDFALKGKSLVVSQPGKFVLSPPFPFVFLFSSMEVI